MRGFTQRLLGHVNTLRRAQVDWFAVMMVVSVFAAAGGIVITLALQ